ncbi:MAG: tetratricopeptide repeat protein [Anaerolineae bacterium]|jgi:predicted ATPase/DNA-binding SARP family transcriptional activator/Tfp pilus assembly protein PilF
MSSLRLLLLGSPRLERDGVKLHVSRRKALAMLAYLAVTGQPHRRETLITLLWPDSDPTLAYSYLRRDLAVLNKVLRPGWLNVSREELEIAHRDDFWLDVTEFKQLLAACTAHAHPPDAVCPRCLPLLSQAVDLYRDDFMAGFTLAGSPTFDEWQHFQTEELRSDLAGALSKLAQAYSAERRLEEAISCAWHWLRLDPLHEPAHRQLMQFYAWAENQAAVENQYQLCTRVLEDELGESPSKETEELYEAIRLRRTPVPAAWADAPISQAMGARHNLPVQATPFVGREEELDEIRHLLLDRPECRILTLVGPGGIGKTRLALRAAEEALGAFTHGIYHVPLASVSSPELLVPAIADALTITFQGRTDPRAQLLNYLREKAMLLLLDNLEHLLDGADLLSDIVCNSREVKLLVTSRERLNLQSEWVREVPGLAFPPIEEPGMGIAGVSSGTQQAHTDAGGLEDYDAVRLMLQSIQRVCPDRSLSVQETAALAQVCQLVEGMPLALELASAWMRIVPLSEIVRQIRQDLNFLATPMRDIPARHRSMRVMFEHSWQLLSGKEQEVVRRASVFRGSFQRDALDQVTDASLPLLATLVDKSMLRTQPSGRYDMHELLRQFAEDKLHEMHGKAEYARDNHASYYLSYLQKLEADLEGASQGEALRAIAADIDNVRAAWNWAADRHKVVEIAQGSEALHLFYFVRGLVDEGLRAFGAAANSLRAVDSTDAKEKEERVKLVLGRLLARQGRFAYRLGLYQEARELLEESLAYLGQLEAAGYPGGRKEKAFSLYHLGIILRGDGRYHEAGELCQRSLAISREYGDLPGVARTLNLLGVIAGALGEYEEARQQLQKALERYTTIGNPYGIANTLNDLSVVAVRQGERAEAKHLQQECLARRREIGHLWGVGTSLNNLGYFAYLDGEYAEARRLLREGLAIQRDIGDQYHIANCLNNLGMVATAAGEYQEASEYFPKALKLALEVGAHPLVLEALAEAAELLVAGETRDKAQVAEILSFVQQHPASDRPTQEKAERGLAELATELAPEAMTAAQERGRARDLEMVVAEMLSEMTLDRAD